VRVPLGQNQDLKTPLEQVAVQHGYVAEASGELRVQDGEQPGDEKMAVVDGLTTHHLAHAQWTCIGTTAQAPIHLYCE